MTDDPKDDTNQNNDDSTYTPTDDDAKHEQAKPPSVKGEEDPLSGDAPVSGQDYDIDEELAKVGLKPGIKPLDVNDQLKEEEK